MRLAYVALAVGLYLWYQSQRPKWLDDMLLRAYAIDHIEDGRKDPYAAEVAGDHGLPLGWVYELQKRGTAHKDLDRRASAVLSAAVKRGAPKDTKPETLAEYKEAVLTEAMAQ